MNKLYLITGATGHIGTALVGRLAARNASVRALVLSDDDADPLPSGIDVCYGDIRDRNSLIPFFQCDEYEHVTLIHCAAFISIASKYNPAVWDINVNGTNHVMELALSRGVDRVLYVSTVHAIPERPFPELITEVHSFSPDLVHGHYARSKAAAAQIVMEYAKKGLHVSMVHPSGVIGPGDTKRRNHVIRTIRAMKAGKIPVAIQGGYDLVDSRDVVEGILACEEKGRAGECYILSGHYVTVKELLNIVRGIAGKPPIDVELPYGLVKAVAPIAERISLLFGNNAPLLTPYSVHTLHSNGFFSHEKARGELGYSPRDIEESIRASL